MALQKTTEALSPREYGRVDPSLAVARFKLAEHRPLLVRAGFQHFKERLKPTDSHLFKIMLASSTLWFSSSSVAWYAHLS